MPRISERPLRRCHLRLWADDYNELRAMFGDSERGLTNAIRAIIHAYVLSQKQKAHAAIDALPQLELSADDLKELEEITL